MPDDEFSRVEAMGIFPGAVASTFATFGPPCSMYFATYRVSDRFRDAPWQWIVRLGLVSVIIGRLMTSGIGVG